MAWVNKDDVKADCSLFDIFGARLAKYVNDEVRDAQLAIVEQIEAILTDGRAVTQAELERIKKEIKIR